jgi:hypothetical protein
MTIELSTITFTEQDDVVPVSGVEQIVNTGIANTLAGEEIITGTAIRGIGTPGIYNTVYGFYNRGTLNTDDDNDIIMGICSEAEGNFNDEVNYLGFSNDEGIIDTGDGNDTIIGATNITPYITSGGSTFNSIGFSSYLGIVNTGNGDDILMGTGQNAGFSNWYSTLATGNGNDMITGTGYVGVENENAVSTFNTGDGNDTIIGNGIRGAGISNNGVMDTGKGNDIIKGTNIITDTDTGYLAGISNHINLTTGDGNDTITGIGGTGIYNDGVINTGNGEDLIIAQGSLDAIDTGYGTFGIYNNGGVINTGNGNDSIIAHGGFESGSNSSGSVFLGNGEDYIKGFGSGNFYGGNGNDTLELTLGTYTVGMWGEGGKSAIFTKGNQLMITSEFERLIAGGTIYDFTSLTAGQIIVVA